MNTIHELKIEAEYFNLLLSGKKTYEIRKDDRGFREGETLYLREYQNKIYTGRILFKKIGHILRDQRFGLKKDYCIMQLH
jgi:hypothetical protein